jgi:hypothetical protein
MAEADETFTLRLSNGVTGTATIINDDGKSSRRRAVSH